MWCDYFNFSQKIMQRTDLLRLDTNRFDPYHLRLFHWGSVITAPVTVKYSTSHEYTRIPQINHQTTQNHVHSSWNIHYILVVQITLYRTQWYSQHYHLMGHVIHIWWDSFVINQILTDRSLHNFAHAITAQLSWHVQNFVVIIST